MRLSEEMVENMKQTKEFKDQMMQMRWSIAISL